MEKIVFLLADKKMVDKKHLEKENISNVIELVDKNKIISIWKIFEEMKKMKGKEAYIIFHEEEDDNLIRETKYLLSEISVSLFQIKGEGELVKID